MSPATAAITALDELLFEPGHWFAIDATNRRVPGVVIVSRPAGLDLIGRGRVASIVGRLRPEVIAADIDLGGDKGAWVMHQIVEWCRERHLWHLVRPSGGAGHWHVLIVHESHLEDLERAVADWRQQIKAAATQIDIRRSLRPLEAPHRTGLPAAAPLFDDRDPNRLVRRLRQLLPATAAPVGVLGRHVHRPADPLAPRPRRRRDLPLDWREYLATGATPELGGSDHSRSTYELIATTALLQAGHTADSAWELVAAAHPSAMTKTRSRGRTWWTRWVWNPAVWRDLQTAPMMSPAPADTPVSATIRATRELLWTLLPGQARRTSVLRVGLAILERMERTGTLRVPVAERDLLLDTGIKDRKTIRAALRLLDDHGVGTLHTTISDRLAAFEFSLPSDRMTQNPPPSNHYPPPPPALWHLLPAGAPVLHTHLRLSPDPLSPTALLQAAGYTSPGAGPTSRQTRDALEVLRGLAHLGLVSCDADGNWAVRRPEDTDTTLRETLVVALGTHSRATAVVERERQSYKARTWTWWHRQRAEALQRQHERHQTWWKSLDPLERARRRRVASQRFVGLPCGDQERLKEEWVAARRTASPHLSEATRHEQWIDSLSEREYQQRCQERALMHAARPPGEQYEFVRAWEAHRGRHGVPRGRGRSFEQPMLIAS